MASSRTFCRNFTTGASSTSEFVSICAPDSSAASTSSSVSSTRSLSCWRRRLAQLLDHPHQLVVLDHDRIDRRLGLELDSVERLQVRWIGDRHRQPCAPLAERDHPRLGRELAVDQILGQLRCVDRGQIEHRVAEGLGRELRQLTGVDRARGDQLIDEAVLRRIRLLLDRQRLVGAQDLVLDQRTRESREHGLLGRMRRSGRNCHGGSGPVSSCGG
jgi:hypothetical protein